ncbi:MAG: hypothetical protein ABFC42_09355 [Sulfuricella sp.]
MKALAYLREIILFFVHRFITEEVALELRPDGDYEIVCAMVAVEPGEIFDGIVTVTSFVFMVWGFTLKIENGGTIKPWPRCGV